MGGGGPEERRPWMYKRSTERERTLRMEREKERGLVYFSD